MPGTRTNTVISATPATCDFVLAYAYRLDEHVVFSGGVQQQSEIGGGARESAGCAARGKRSNEHARVAVVILHADAVAQDRAARDAAGGIHGENAHGFPIAANGADEGIHQSALPGAGRSGDAGDDGVLGARGQFAQQRGTFGCAILDGCCRASERASVTTDDLVDPIRH